MSLALCPPVTASDGWAAVIVPRCLESPQEIPPTKPPPGWNVGIVLVLHSFDTGHYQRSLRTMWRSEECRRPTLGWGGGASELEDSDGEVRGTGASSANPQLAGWGEVRGPLCWRGRPSPRSALHPFCQTYLRNEGCFAWTLAKGMLHKADPLMESLMEKSPFILHTASSYLRNVWRRGQRCDT